MAIHVYECENCGMRLEFIEAADRETKGMTCPYDGVTGRKRCGFPLVLSAAVTTGTPVLKRGCGGFHKPSD